jgi:hypothetical protein
MIYNFKYSNDFRQRPEVVEYLKQKKYSRVLDVGGSVNSWSSPYITHCTDIQPHNNTSVHQFIGNISTYSIWKNILDDVKKNGKFDFVICTHTLEDISSPQLVCEFLPLIANEGYIAVPSKYMEFIKHEGWYNGWIHHRWIFNKEGNNFVAYPKLSFLEDTNILSAFGWDNNSKDIPFDLSFFWKENFTLNIINNDYMGPDVKSVMEYYLKLQND